MSKNWNIALRHYFRELLEQNRCFMLRDYRLGITKYKHNTVLGRKRTYVMGSFCSTCHPSRKYL